MPGILSQIIGIPEEELFPIKAQTQKLVIIPCIDNVRIRCRGLVLFPCIDNIRLRCMIRALSELCPSCQFSP